jgi:hypothetical protein
MFIFEDNCVDHHVNSQAQVHDEDGQSCKGDRKWNTVWRIECRNEQQLSMLNYFVACGSEVCG